MRLNNLEKHFAEKMNEYPSALDTNALWATLESDLDKKKKRRIVIILLTLILFVAIGGFTLYQIKTPQNQLIKLNIDRNENVDSPIYQATSFPQKKNNGEYTSPNTHVKINSIQQEDRTQKERQIFIDELKDNLADVDNAVGSNEKLPSMNTQSNSIEIKPKPALVDINVPISSVLGFEEITRLNFSKIDYNKEDFDLNSIAISRKISSNKKWSLSIAPTFGIFYTDRKISPKKGSAANLKDLRNSSEKVLETLSLGIGIELISKNNFFLTSGVNFNQITERFDNQTSEFTTEDIEIVTEINYLSNGEREEVLGIYEQPQEIVTTTKVYNTLRWVEFNVGGGYLFSINRWDLGASGGLLFGSMLNGEGRIFDVDNKIIEIDNQSPSIYKSNLGIGTFANLEARFSPKSRLSISAKIGYKSMSSSFTELSYPLEINYQWWGTIIGLHYEIF